MIRMLVPIGVVALAVTLVGCAPTYSDATARTLQQQVLQVTEAAAAGDWATARGALDALSDEVEEARADGRIDDERLAEMDSAISAVSADLDASIAAEAEAAAAAAAEQQRIADEDAAGPPDKGKKNGHRGPKGPGRG